VIDSENEVCLDPVMQASLSKDSGTSEVFPSSDQSQERVGGWWIAQVRTMVGSIRCRYR
jgi:hypothetical protein